MKEKGLTASCTVDDYMEGLPICEAERHVVYLETAIELIYYVDM